MSSVPWEDISILRDKVANVQVRHRTQHSYGYNNFKTDVVVELDLVAKRV